MKKTLAVVFFSFLTSFSAVLDVLPVNTWVRVASSPGDGRGREVAPGHASSWVYEPNVKKFYRFGGFTPNFSNALYSFDPESLVWKCVRPHDESYPVTRPGGGSNTSMMYDSVRKAIWITGSFHSFYQTGDHGVWLYFAANDSFAKVASSAYNVGVFHAFDPVHNVILASPPPSKLISNGNQTLLFDATNFTWTSYSTTPTPQEYHYGNFQTIFDPSLNKFVVLRMLVEYGIAQKTKVWTFDPVSHNWAVLDSASLFTSRQFPAVAYEPLHNVLFLYGGFKQSGSNVTETWVYKTETKAWKQISAPGLPVMKDAVLFPQAIAYDPVHQCMMLNDPQLGVWAFKYDPDAAAGTTVLNAESLAIGKSAANPPATGETEAELTAFPSALNSNLIQMADNSLYLMTSNSGTGNEVTWNYDPDAGVILKYGGCGNSSSPYWSGYGNNLDIYDPGTDKWLCRRTGEISGANRPRNGCTRSVLYDTKRKEWHFFGGTGSGPYNPPYLSSYTYDIKKDSFTYKAAEGTMPLGHVGCVLSYDADHDITIFPDSGKTYVFNFETGFWQTRIANPSPGRLDVYQRTAYASSVKKFVVLQARITGTDSVMETWTYDPEQNLWTNLTSTVRPPYRACKYGLAYDSKNDVVLLAGGQVRWGGTAMSDMWIYHVTTNIWEEVKPAKVNGNFPNSEVMCTAYDTRHNVFLIGTTYGGPLLAYRYKTGATNLENENFKRKEEIQASPNPFNPSVTLTLSGMISKQTLIKVYDYSGRLVAEFSKSAGSKQVVWNASNMASGIYTVRVVRGDRIITKKIVYSK